MKAATGFVSSSLWSFTYFSIFSFYYSSLENLPSVMSDPRAMSSFNSSGLLNPSVMFEILMSTSSISLGIEFNFSQIVCSKKLLKTAEGAFESVWLGLQLPGGRFICLYFSILY